MSLGKASAYPYLGLFGDIDLSWVKREASTRSLFRFPSEQSFTLVQFFLEDGLGKGIHL